jgi:hypothetical protein
MTLTEQKKPEIRAPGIDRPLIHAVANGSERRTQGLDADEKRHAGPGQDIEGEVVFRYSLVLLCNG